MTDRELLARYASGSAEAFTGIVERHTGKVYGTCRRILGDRHAAEDAAQAVFLVLARKARGLAPATILSGWLFLTARQVALRHRQKEVRRARHEREAAAVRSEAEKSETWQRVCPRLDQALAGLPRRQREAVVARYLDGRTPAQIGAEMNCPPSTAGTWIARGLAGLRTRLARGGVAVPAAALAGLLAEHAATTAPAGLASSINAACLGAAPASATALTLAEGTMKTMMWMKIKVAATVICVASVVGGGGAVAVRGLLAAEPKGATKESAKPKFPINPKVAAMKDNTWIKLPTPKKHPICRSSSPWMPYVPSAGVGILWGCSHSGYHNDVWTYDLARNKWTENLPTEPSAKRDPGVLKYKDGLLMTRKERPLSMHQWGFMDYDPDRKVLWHLGGWWQGVYSVSGHYKKIGKKIKVEGDPGKHKRLSKKGPLLWKYSLKANKWEVVYTEDSTTGTYKGTRHRYIRYCPAIRKLIMTPKALSLSEARERFKTYDPDTNKWARLNVTWKPIDKSVSPYWFGKHSPTVYDAKRKALVFIYRGVWLLDPVKKTMTQVVAKDKGLYGNLDGPVGVYVYDSVGERVLGIFVNYTQYNSGKVLKARGFPTDRTNVWALDVEKKKWVLQPKPADGALPPLNKLGSLHHFYDPVQNATFIFRGGYNRANGECWVYRYKRARK
jgi:RNA polymerase sigma factor (sigma-70 family)